MWGMMYNLDWIEEKGGASEMGGNGRVEGPIVVMAMRSLC